METRVAYMAVGLFVIVLGAALLGIGLWLSADLSRRDYTQYTIYTTESVAGLTGNADVKFHGVHVGRVRRIELVPERPGEVRIRLDVLSTAPIRADTTARLSTQGLTGIAHVELRGGSADAGPAEIPTGEPYPVIPMEPSLINRIELALQQSMDMLDLLTGQMTRLLADENLDAVTATLSNLERLTAALAANSHRLEALLASSEQTLNELGRASAALPPLFQRLHTTVDQVDVASRSFERAARSVGGASEDISTLSLEGVEALRAFSSTALPQLHELLIELQEAAGGIGRLAEELGERPNRLIFGRPDRPRGPGE